MSEVQKKTSWLDTAIVAGLALLAIAFWAFRIIGPAKQLPNAWFSLDIFTEIYPMSYRASMLLREGVLPLWNPYQYCGHPFLAVSLYGLLYPPNALYLVLPTTVAVEAVVVLHLALAGCFTYHFARALVLRRDAACCAAILYMLSGSIIALAAWSPPALAASVWLPLALLSIERILQKHSLGWALALGISIAMPILAGWPQVWVYSSYAIAGYAAVRLLARGVRARELRPILTSSGLLALGLALGCCLLAGQVLPSLELQSLSPRRVGGLTLLQMLPYGPLPPTKLFASMVDGDPGWPRPPYLGIAALLLIPMSLCPPRGGLRTLYFWALGAFALLISISLYTPLFELCRLLPGGAAFRDPQRILILYAFCGSVLGGMGLDAIGRPDFVSGGRLRARIAIGLTTVGVGLAAWGFMSNVSHLYFSLGLGLVVALCVVSGRRSRQVLVLGLIALLIVDLSRATRNDYLHPFHDPSVFDRNLILFDYVREHQGLDRTYISWSIEVPSMMSKQGTLRQIYSITDYDALSLLRYDRFYRMLEPEELRRPANYTFAGALATDLTSPTFPLLDLMSVRFLIVPNKDRRFQQALAEASERWRLVLRSGFTEQYSLFERTDVLPRAYVAHEGIYASNEADVLPLLTRQDFDPRRNVVLETAPLPDGPPEPTMAASAIRPARITAYEANTVAVSTDDPLPGWLVLTDTAYPGWEAGVDGESAPIVTANYLFRAVRIPAGSHTVTFRYRPMSVRIGLVLTGFGWAVIALYTIFAVTRTRMRALRTPTA